MIDFSKHRTDGCIFCLTDERRDMLKFRTDKIYDALSDIKTNKFRLGCYLIDFYHSKLFTIWANVQIMDELREKYHLSYSVGNCSYDVFFAYCEKFFHLDKSQVSRYMNIVDEFGDGQIDFKEEWKAYSYSQLVELLSLTPEQRKSVLPFWTVKAIREYKKELVAMSQPTEISDSQKSVATSQQKNEKEFISKQAKDSRFKYDAIDIPLTCDIFDYTKYDKFRGYSLRNLLDYVIKVEEDCQRLRALSDMDITAADDEDIPVFNNGKISPI